VAPNFAPAATAPARSAAGPTKDWDAFYKAHDETPVDFTVRITALREKKQFKDVEQAIKAYLRYRGKHATPWMYEILAVTIELNKGDARNVKSAIGYAAYLAKRGRDPMQMTSVADLMVVHHLNEVTVKDAQGKADRTTVGELLDLANERSPGWFEPLVMSVALAERTKDADRMGTTLEKFLALGWPKLDETVRDEAHRRAETLAKALRADGRGEEASKLLERLKDAESRDIYVRLSWTGDAGIGLSVEEPLGAIANFKTPRTVFGGAHIKDGLGKHPESIYVCPRAFDGDYKVRFQVLYNDEKAPVREATLEIILHEGTPQERKETRTVLLDKPDPVTFRLEGGRRTTVLPYQAPPTLRIVRDPKSKTAETAKPSTSTPAPASRPGTATGPRS
jgi:hypothetical protein